LVTYPADLPNKQLCIAVYLSKELDNTQISQIYAAKVPYKSCERGSCLAKMIGKMENKAAIQRI
jgi:hypothetical protein